MVIERFFEMPRVYTFEQPKLRRWVESRCIGRTLNVFAGRVRLDVDEFRNDIDPAAPADLHVDARNIAAHLNDQRFQTAIIDPPYSMFQAVHSYGGRRVQDITAVRESVNSVLDHPARVISLGWNTTGMGVRRGYIKRAILICNGGGSHNDILVTVEDRDDLGGDGASLRTGAE